MLTRIDPENEKFFRSIIEISVEENASMFPRMIVILHPGTEVKNDDGFPFRAPNCDDRRMSGPQCMELEYALRTVFGPQTPCSLAVYAGFLRDPQFREGLEPAGTNIEENLRYVVFNAELNDCSFYSMQDRWGDFLSTELSYLWARDRSWLVTSSPDTAVTIVGCDNDLAQALLDAPELGAFEWWNK